VLIFGGLNSLKAGLSLVLIFNYKLLAFCKSR